LYEVGQPQRPKMFEATLKQGAVFQKVIGGITELVTEANFDCSEEGLNLQAMDSSHVSLVALQLRADGFENYRCDKGMSLGLSLANLTKVLKCMNSKDSITLRGEDEGDTLSFVFEDEEESRVSNFDLKLMDIDAEQLGIPDTEYQCIVRMPSGEFQRICRDMQVLGDTITINATKEGVKFSVSGDIGTGDMTLKHTKDVAEDKSPDEVIKIELQDNVSQTFALRYLNFFTKATPLSKTVNLYMSPEVPLMVEYAMEELGFVRYYLAPKIEDDE